MMNIILDENWDLEFIMEDLKYEIDNNFTLDQEMTEEEYWELRNALRDED